MVLWLSCRLNREFDEKLLFPITIFQYMIKSPFLSTKTAWLVGCAKIYSGLLQNTSQQLNDFTLILLIIDLYFSFIFNTIVELCENLKYWSQFYQHSPTILSLENCSQEWRVRCCNNNI